MFRKLEDLTNLVILIRFQLGLNTTNLAYNHAHKRAHNSRSAGNIMSISWQ